MKSLGDDSLPIDVTRDERFDTNKMIASLENNQLPPQAIEDIISPQHITNVSKSAVDGSYVHENYSLKKGDYGYVYVYIKY